MDHKIPPEEVHFKKPEEEIDYLRGCIEKLESEIKQLEIYKEIIEFSSLGYIKTNTEGKIEYANAPVHKILCYDNKELIGESILKIYPIEYKYAMTKYLETFVKNKPTPKPYYGELLKNHGGVIEAKVLWSCISNKYEDITGFIQIVEDLTEQKQRENLLYNSKSRLESLMEHAPIMVMEFDSDFRHIFINNAVKNITGADPEFFIGKTMTESGLPDFIAKQWTEKIKNVFETSKPTDDVTDVGIKIYYSIITPVLDSRRRVKSVMVTTADITHLEERVEELKKEAEANAPRTSE